MVKMPAPRKGKAKGADYTRPRPEVNGTKSICRDRYYPTVASLATDANTCSICSDT